MFHGLVQQFHRCNVPRCYQVYIKLGNLERHGEVSHVHGEIDLKPLKPTCIGCGQQITVLARKGVKRPDKNCVCGICTKRYGRLSDNSFRHAHKHTHTLNQEQ